MPGSHLGVRAARVQKEVGRPNDLTTYWGLRQPVLAQTRTAGKNCRPTAGSAQGSKHVVRNSPACSAVQLDIGPRTIGRCPCLCCVRPRHSTMLIGRSGVGSGAACDLLLVSTLVDEYVRGRLPLAAYRVSRRCSNMSESSTLQRRSSAGMRTLARLTCGRSF